MKASARILAVLSAMLFLAALCNAQCVDASHSCVTSITISPSTIRGDKSQQARATVQVYISTLSDGLGLEITETGFSGPISCGPSGLQFPGIGSSGGCKYANLTPGIINTVTFQFVADNITGVTQMGSILVDALTYSDPGKSASVTVNPVANPQVAPPQQPDAPSTCNNETAQTGPPACGNPINLATGNTWISQQDYSIPGLGGGISLTRTWNSLWSLMQPVEQSGIFGDSWRSNFEERIQVLTGGVVKYWKGNGSSLFYLFNSLSGTYGITAPADDQTTLSFNSTSMLWTIAQKDGTQRIFNN